MLLFFKGLIVNIDDFIFISQTLFFKHSGIIYVCVCRCAFFKKIDLIIFVQVNHEKQIKPIKFLSFLLKKKQTNKQQKSTFYELNFCYFI